MKQDPSEVLLIAEKIRNDCFPKAGACLLAGSVIRGEATAYSDLDLIVVFDRVQNAQRKSFSFANWPVEAFIHDPQTLKYFFWNVDRPSGIPSLPNMVSEGIEIPQETNLGRLVKDLADRVLKEGPIPWDHEERENARYAISDLVEDIRAPRNANELCIVTAQLYTASADYFCRSRNQWSAKGKNIPKNLMKISPEFQRLHAEAFATAFIDQDASAVIQLCAQILEPDGGFLFEGFIRNAPSDWRVPDP